MHWYRVNFHHEHSPNPDALGVLDRDSRPLPGHPHTAVFPETVTGELCKVTEDAVGIGGVQLGALKIVVTDCADNVYHNGGSTSDCMPLKRPAG
jgi:hypothetical protein